MDASAARQIPRPFRTRHRRRPFWRWLGPGARPADPRGGRPLNGSRGPGGSSGSTGSTGSTGRAGQGGRAAAALCALLIVGCAPIPSDTAGEPLEAWAPQSEIEHLRAARTLFEQQRFAAARAQLAYASEWLPDHLEALRAQLLRAEGDLDGALRTAQRALAMDLPAALRSELHRQIAEIELQQGNIAGAYASARLAWETSADDEAAAEAAFGFAEELERRGLPGEAMLLFRTVWERWPTSERSSRAFEHSRRLGERLGADRPEVDSLLEAGERLRDLFRCREAEPFFTAPLERGDLGAEAARRARRGQADCAFQTRRYPEAAERYRALAAEDAGDFDAAILAARSRGRAGDPAGAVRELEQIARRAPADIRPRVLHLIALLVEDDDPKRERSLLREVAAQRYDRGLEYRARWTLAWRDLEVRKYQSALRWLEPITRGSKWDIEVQRARYWTAVANQTIDPDLGRQQLFALADEIALTYYGLLAADRLGLKPQVMRSFMEPRSVRGTSARPARRATLLLEAGWQDAARAELLSWLRRGSLSREERMAAAEMLHRLGDHFSAVRLVVNGFGGNLDQGVDPLWRDAWRFAWPAPFDATVRRATREFDFESSLVYAIMREESLYRPRVESAAGARGLMQLIPPTAQRIAQKLQIDEFEPENLYEPETNVRFGTYYLKELVEQFGGSRPYAIAAYNAGPEAVRRWLEREGSVADDQFVDSVPYGETRRYLRRVLRSYRVYQLLYAGDAQLGGSAPDAARQAQSSPR